jgi:hypothetical protein
VGHILSVALVLEPGLGTVEQEAWCTNKSRGASVPDSDGPLLPILQFAQTYNAYERLAGGGSVGRFISPVTKALTRTGEPPAWAGVDRLRGALFFLQRQTHLIARLSRRSRRFRPADP